MRDAEAIRTVFGKELRELLRDRRSLLVMFGVPLVVYPLLFAGLGKLTQATVEQQRLRLANVAVVNGEAAPELMRRLRLPEHRLQIAEVEPDDEAVRLGTLDAVLVIPAEAERILLTAPPTAPPPPPESHPLAPPSSPPSVAPASESPSAPLSDSPPLATPSAPSPTGASPPGAPAMGETARVDGAAPPAAEKAEAEAGGPRFVIRVDRSRADSDATQARLWRILTEYERWVIERRLQDRDQPVHLLAPIPRTTVDLATQDQRLGRFLSQLLPLLLLMTGMLGAFFPALNATTTERELGTLETLLVTPVSRTQLLVAKGVLVLLCSIVTAGLNMVSMSLVLANLAAGAREMLGPVAVNPTALLLSFLATIPALVLFAALVLLVGLIARNYREANSFAAPVMMLPMAALAVGMVDPPSTQALMSTPVANTALLIRDILTDRLSLGHLFLASAANLLFAAVVVLISARLFTNEQLVNPSWEPVSLRGLRRRRASDPSAPTRYPTVDAVLLLVAVALLVQFYAGPHLGRLLAEGAIGIPLLVLVLQVGSFVLPGAALLLLGRYRVAEVALLRLPGRRMDWSLALLAGAGLSLLAVWANVAIREVTGAAPSDASRTVAELVGRQLEVSLAMAVLAFAVVPGVCEEFFFRGVMLPALRKRLPMHAAVWITAAVFSAVHLDLAGFPIRLLLGAALGYLALASGSLLPAMLLHAAFNATQLLLLGGIDRGVLPAGTPEQLADPMAPIWLVSLGVGAVLTAIAWALLRARRGPGLPPPAPPAGTPRAT